MNATQTAPKLSPKMQELVEQLRAGTHVIGFYAGHLARGVVGEDGIARNFRSCKATGEALLSRGILAKIVRPNGAVDYVLAETPVEEAPAVEQPAPVAEDATDHKAAMNEIIAARSDEMLLTMHKEATAQLRELARDDNKMSDRAAYRMVIDQMGRELLRRGYVLCGLCLKWTDSHASGGCLTVTRHKSERVHLRMLLATRVVNLREKILSALSVDELLVLDADSHDEAKEAYAAPSDGVLKLDRMELTDVRDLIDNELEARGWGYCFFARSYQEKHEVTHCV